MQALVGLGVEQGVSPGSAADLLTFPPSLSPIPLQEQGELDFPLCHSPGLPPGQLGTESWGLHPLTFPWTKSTLAGNSSTCKLRADTGDILVPMAGSPGRILAPWLLLEDFSSTCTFPSLFGCVAPAVSGSLCCLLLSKSLAAPQSAG